MVHGTDARILDAAEQQDGAAKMKWTTPTSSIKNRDDINRNIVTAAIKNMKPYKTDIPCMPWYWGGQDEKEHNANRATCTVTIHDFKWKSAEGCRPAPDPALAGIRPWSKN